MITAVILTALMVILYLNKKHNEKIELLRRDLETHRQDQVKINCFIYEYFSKRSFINLTEED